MKKNLDTIIFEKLKEEIIASRWRPGQQITTEELAEQFDVSRTPVIQAVKMMAMEGIITVRTNGRIEIPVYTPAQVVDLCKVRVLLEDYALKAICAQKKEIEVRKLNDIAKDCYQQFHQYNNTLETRKLDLKLHRQIVESSGSEYLLGCYRRVQSQFMTANHIYINNTNEVQSMSSQEHFGILEHLVRYDYKKASKALERHIMAGCQRILQCIEEPSAASISKR